MFIPDWLARLRFAFSRKCDGQMSFKRSEVSVVRRNRERFFARNELDLEQAIGGELAHGAKVADVGSPQAGQGGVRPDWLKGVDALVTSDPDVILLTTHADCAPLVVYDHRNQVLGQAHAGWRSLAAGIVENLVDAVQAKNRGFHSELQAWIGPTIRSCCYPVSLDVAERFPVECRFLVGESIRLDLVRFIRMELERLNFKPKNVSDAGICTSCAQEFSSFRRDGFHAEAMVCATGLRKRDTAD